MILTGIIRVLAVNWIIPQVFSIPFKRSPARHNSINVSTLKRSRWMVQSENFRFRWRRGPRVTGTQSELSEVRTQAFSWARRRTRTRYKRHTQTSLKRHTRTSLKRHTRIRHPRTRQELHTQTHLAFVEVCVLIWRHSTPATRRTSYTRYRRAQR